MHSATTVRQGGDTIADSNNGEVSHRSRFLDRSDTLILKRGALRVPRFLFRYAITLPMSAKRMKGFLPGLLANEEMAQRSNPALSKPVTGRSLSRLNN